MLGRRRVGFSLRRACSLTSGFCRAPFRAARAKLALLRPATWKSSKFHFSVIFGHVWSSSEPVRKWIAAVSQTSRSIWPSPKRPKIRDRLRRVADDQPCSGIFRHAFTSAGTAPDKSI
jgi:hypothetical protein